MMSDDRGAVIYQLKLTVHGSEPPIWRRLQIPADTRMDTVHELFEASMGWDLGSMHEFTLGWLTFGGDHLTPHHYPEYEFADETKICLLDLDLTGEHGLGYEAWFGNETLWTIEAELEEMLPCDCECTLPICTDAMMAAPPQHLSDLEHYYRMIEVLSDSEHPWHNHYLKLMSGYLSDEGQWDIEAVDLDEINEELKRRWERR